MTIIFPFLSAILSYFSFPPINLWWLGFFSSVPLFIFVYREEKFSRVFFGSFLYRLIFAALFLLFLPDPFFILLTTAIWMGFPLAAWFIKKIKLPPLGFFILLALNFVLWEYMEARFTPLPAYISMLGNTLAQSPWLGLAKFGGLPALSLFLGLANSLIAFILLKIFWYSAEYQNIFSGRLSIGRIGRIWKFRFRDYSPKQDFPGRLIGTPIAILILFLWGGGILSKTALSAAHHNSGQRQLNMAAVSVTADFDKELTRYSEADFLASKENWQWLKNYISFRLAQIEQEVQNKKIDLLLLPEDMINIELPNNTNEAALKNLGIKGQGILLESYRELARRNKINVFANLTTFDGSTRLTTDGSTRLTTDGSTRLTTSKKYNSSVLIDREGNFAGITHKYYLSIAGEYWPFGDWIPFYWRWGWKNLPPNTKPEETFIDFSPTGQYSPSPKPFETLSLDNISFGSSICLESGMPTLQKIFEDKGAKFLVHSSSNKWVAQFRKSYLDRVMNLRRIESVETGLPIVTVGKEDYAGFVLPNGEIISQYPPRDKNFILLINTISI